jgi:hypothetical protein
LKPTAFEYQAPTTAAEAVGLLAKLGDEAKLLARGTEPVPMLELRLVSSPSRSSRARRATSSSHTVSTPDSSRAGRAGGAASRASVALAVIADLASSGQSNEGSLIIGDPAV